MRLDKGTHGLQKRDYHRTELLSGDGALATMSAKETQIRFKMQKDGEPIWDQMMIDRLGVTTQREAMIESGPPPADKPQPSRALEQKVQKEQTKK